METKTYQGWLYDNGHLRAPLICEAESREDSLFLLEEAGVYGGEPALAELLADDIAHRQVNVRYWISDKALPVEQILSDWYSVVSGYADAEYSLHYSDITGYLWTDEDVIIGGHDLLCELRSHHGKYLTLIIDIHPQP